MNINTTLSIVERIEDQFRKMIFADHEYFCILYAVVSHIRTGYEIRTVSDSLLKYYQERERDKVKNEDRDRDKEKGEENKGRNSLSSEKDKEKKNQNIVIGALQEYEPNLTRLYEKLIIDQMQILERLSGFYKEVER